MWAVNVYNATSKDQPGKGTKPTGVERRSGGTEIGEKNSGPFEQSKVTS